MPQNCQIYKNSIFDPLCGPAPVQLRVAGKKYTLAGGVRLLAGEREAMPCTRPWPSTSTQRLYGSSYTCRGMRAMGTAAGTTEGGEGLLQTKVIGCSKPDGFWPCSVEGHTAGVLSRGDCIPVHSRMLERMYRCLSSYPRFPDLDFSALSRFFFRNGTRTLSDLCATYDDKQNRGNDEEDRFCFLLHIKTNKRALQQK